MREPWFSIIDVCDARGQRSIADIAKELVAGSGVSLAEVRGPLRTKDILRLRREIIIKVRKERPDLESRHLADFLNRDPSSVRHHWRVAA